MKLRLFSNMSVKFGFTIHIYKQVTRSQIEQVEEKWLILHADVCHGYQGGQSRGSKAIKEDRCGFQLKLSIGHISTAFRPVQSLVSYRFHQLVDKLYNA